VSGFALGVEGIEVLLQPKTCGYKMAQRLIGALSPKNRGPDQKVPVILRANSESER
jgi:hypothetical protein